MTGYPYTVTVGPADGGWRWLCGCERRGWSADERLCRDAGLAHQLTHKRQAEEDTNG